MQLFVRSRGNDLELLDTEPAQTVADFLAERNAGVGAALWLEEAEEPLGAELTLRDAGVDERSRVHVSTCGRISVTVRYNGERSKEFPPGATVGAVYAWAAGPQGFGLSESERAKHTLGLCGTNTEPDRAEHVGSLAGEDCSVCFDLAPKDRFAG
jgi:hypothetical protein